MRKVGCHPEGIYQGSEDKDLIWVHMLSFGKLLELEDGGWGRMKMRMG